MNNISADTAEYIEKIIFELHNGKNQKGVDKFRAVCKCACEHSGELILVILRDFTGKRGCAETLCLGTLDNKNTPIFLSPSRRFEFMVGGKHAFCVIPSSNGVRICESNITIFYPFSIWEYLDAPITKGSCGPRFEIKIGPSEVRDWFIKRNEIIPQRSYISAGKEMSARLGLTLTW